MNSNDRNNKIEIANKFASAMMSFVNMDLDYFKYLRNRDRFYVGIEDTTYNQTIYNRKKKLKPKEDPVGGFFFPTFPKPKPPRTDPVYVDVPVFDPVQINILVQILLNFKLMSQRQ